MRLYKIKRGNIKYYEQTKRGPGTRETRETTLDRWANKSSWKMWSLSKNLD